MYRGEIKKKRTNWRVDEFKNTALELPIYRTICL